MVNDGASTPARWGHMSKTESLLYWLTDRLIRFAIALLLMLPFDLRRQVGGWLMTRVVAPIGGYRGRIRDNLNLIFPDLSEAEVWRLVHDVPDNLGRTLIELYSARDFIARIADEPLTGAGVDALAEAHAAGRPVLLVTGHIGNYDAIRAALILRGYRVGGLYRPMGNPFFNEHYVAAISAIGRPLFPRGRKGLTDMVRFLRGGGMLGVVLDQHMEEGELLIFMGHPARTALSSAELALRYGALVVPTYGIRRPDGGFDLIIEAPVPHGTAQEMTQRLNDSLEAQVRAHMDQWLWTHRRWKEKKRRRARKG